MLVLKRKLGERVVIDNNVVITVVEIGLSGVRLGIEAPEHVQIMREEIMSEAQRDRAIASGVLKPKSQL